MTRSNGWNKFVCASPVSRTKVILSKYVAGIFSIVVMNAVIMLDNAAVGSPLPAWSYPFFCA